MTPAIIFAVLAVAAQIGFLFCTGAVILKEQGVSGPGTARQWRNWGKAFALAALILAGAAGYMIGGM